MKPATGPSTYLPEQRRICFENWLPQKNPTYLMIDHVFHYSHCYFVVFPIDQTISGHDEIFPPGFHCFLPCELAKNGQARCLAASKQVGML